MEYPKIYVTLMLGLVLCAACFITGTGELSSHCGLPCKDCDTGWYGDNCTKACNLKCYGNVCNKTTGKCLSCKAGYHSFNCTLKCPPNCLNDSGRTAKCDRDRANCTNCHPTWWGSKCMNKCDNKCQNGVCDFEDGHCHECKTGKTGENCSEECPSGCRDHQCHRDNMTCTGGCNLGYVGERCDKKCDHNCDKLCSQNNVTCSSSSSSSSSSDRITGVAKRAIAGSVTGICIIVVTALVLFLVITRTRHCDRWFGRCRRIRSSQSSEVAETEVLANLAQDDHTSDNV